MYHLPNAYTPRPEPDYFTANAPDGKLWQPDVYHIAADIAQQNGFDTLIDVGCGQAHKLAPYLGDFRIIGFDYGENIEYCKQTYPDGAWLDVDLEDIEPGYRLNAKNGVIICADVIEHMKNPHSLLTYLNELRHKAPVILTTPDRYRTYGYDHAGPPMNPHHVREWSLSEMQTLLAEYDIPVSFAGYTRSNNVDSAYNTMFIVLGNHDLDMSAYPLEPARGGDNRPDVSVLIPAYNAEDTLANAVLSALEQEGLLVEVCICDDASTDNTSRVIIDLANDHIEQIKAIRHDTNQMQHEALNSVASLAMGRYFIQLDADDTLAPNSLKQLVEALDAAPSGVGLAYGATTFYGASEGLYRPPAPFARQHFYQGFVSMYGFMYRREAYDLGCRYRALMDIDGKPITVQDWDMALQLTEHMGYSAIVLPDVEVLRYRMQENSLKNRKDAHKPEILAAFKQVWPQVVAQQI